MTVAKEWGDTAQNGVNNEVMLDMLTPTDDDFAQRKFVVFQFPLLRISFYTITYTNWPLFLHVTAIMPLLTLLRN